MSNLDENLKLFNLSIYLDPQSFGRHCYANCLHTFLLADHYNPSYIPCRRQGHTNGSYCHKSSQFYFKENTIMVNSDIKLYTYAQLGSNKYPFCKPAKT